MLPDEKVRFVRRKKTQRRSTRETRVHVSLDLDGSGKHAVRMSPRSKFLAHMLESLAKFARFDLTVRSTGDFQHHEEEDVALTLGRALREALAGRPVRRVGSATLAMDDAVVTVVVDLVDRPYVRVDLPDDMLEHFLRSFGTEARITLHNLVHRGKNSHHIQEATFKALGLALREATRPAESLLSTKSKVRWK